MLDRLAVERGFELARLTADDLESLCDQHAEDVDRLRDTALKAITADLRDGLRRGYRASSVAMARFIGR
jgi:hypothetical protein